MSARQRQPLVAELQADVRAHSKAAEAKALAAGPPYGDISPARLIALVTSWNCDLRDRLHADVMVDEAGLDPGMPRGDLVAAASVTWARLSTVARALAPYI